MYEEWFQSVSEELHIDSIRYLGNNIEIEIPENISLKLDGEKLYLQIYSINPKFRLK